MKTLLPLTLMLTLIRLIPPSPAPAVYTEAEIHAMAYSRYGEDLRITTVWRGTQVGVVGGKFVTNGDNYYVIGIQEREPQYISTPFGPILNPRGGNDIPGHLNPVLGCGDSLQKAWDDTFVDKQGKTAADRCK